MANCNYEFCTFLEYRLAKIADANWKSETIDSTARIEKRRKELKPLNLLGRTLYWLNPCHWRLQEHDRQEITESAEAIQEIMKEVLNHPQECAKNRSPSVRPHMHRNCLYSLPFEKRVDLVNAASLNFNALLYQLHIEKKIDSVTLIAQCYPPLQNSQEISFEPMADPIDECHVNHPEQVLEKKSQPDKSCENLPLKKKKQYRDNRKSYTIQTPRRSKRLRRKNYTNDEKLCHFCDAHDKKK